MLSQLHIKNVALISEEEINFTEGFNILTGETGAGKSMVIDAVNFALGERTSKDFIRSGADQAEVSAFFLMENPKFAALLAEEGIPAEEDGSLLIRRTMQSNGKTMAKVNGCTVTVGMLKKISESLMDVHGQHEHQSLLHQSRHLGLLDAFCGSALQQMKTQLQGWLKQYREIEKELSATVGAGEDKERLVSLLQYQMDEIAAANLTLGEEETLFARKKRLANGEKIRTLTGRSLSNLFGDRGAVDLAQSAAADLEKLSALDEEVLPVAQSLNDACVALEDAGRELRAYYGDLSSNPEELREIEDRLDVLYRLKRKYGGSEEAVLAQYQVFLTQLDALENSEALRQKLTKDMEAAEKEILSLCAQITALRKETAAKVAERIQEELHGLAMPSAQFVIEVLPKDSFGSEGMDRVEFLISPNLGEAPKPLAKIASGGEMSRVMLAMKAVLGNADGVETLIFDEIDTGVSGRTAGRVGEKLRQLGEGRQVICITHLPQIAALAMSHFLIEKREEAGHTATAVTLLDDEGAVREVARLMGGDTVTEATLEAARALRKK